MDTSVCVVADKKGHLQGSKAGDKLALCIFDDIEDAERHLISWGERTQDWFFHKAEGWDDILDMLSEASSQFEYATIDPPLHKGKRFTVFHLNTLINQIKQHIYHPYA